MGKRIRASQAVNLNATKYVLLILWFPILFLLGVTFYSSGLLLNRNILPYKSKCLYNTTQHYYELETKSIQDQYCISKDYKVIMIVVDALRYDFVNYNESYQSVYHNRLPIVYETLKSNKDKSRLYKFIADAPTTTMQRINAMTTGTLPTFIDIGSNFQTSEINEDNIIDCILRENKHVAMLGDDTWVNLFPNRFQPSFPFHSFNTWDLDTVDNGILKEINKVINQKHKWDLLIAHFLGIDHCAHRYGPEHPQMIRKLTQMNDVLTKIIKHVKTMEKTILLVLGDHGMTMEGDHGGDSENEVTSALFTYFPTGKFLDINMTNVVKQVDLVPTLAAILGVPIPFSNIGTVILNTLPNGNSEENLFSLHKNAVQIKKYMDEYIKLNKQNIDEKKLLKISNFPEKIEENSLIKFMEDVQKICRELWIQFDDSSILIGLTISITVIIFTILFHEFSNSVFMKNIQDNIFLKYFYLIQILLIFYLFELKGKLAIVFIILINYEMIRKNYKIPEKTDSLKKLGILGINFLTMILLFSNSFIIQEQNIIRFFLLTALWILINKETNKLIINTVLYSVLIKFTSAIFYKCREEQINCKFFEIDSNFSFLISIGFSICVSYFMKYFLCYFQVIFITLLFVSNENDIDYLTGSILLGGIFGYALIVYTVPFRKNKKKIIKFGRKYIIKNYYNLFGTFFLYLTFILFIVFLTIFGKMYSVTTVFMFTSIWYLAFIISMSRRHSLSLTVEFTSVSWMYTSMWNMSAIYWFYATGHNCTFAGIDWNAAFLAYKDIGNSVVIPGLLVIVNTFASYIIHAIFLPLLLVSPFILNAIKNKYLPLRNTNRIPVDIDIILLDNEAFICHALYVTYAKYILFFALRLFVMMASAALHRRHLMMWSIFAPKLIFELLAFVVTVITVVIAYISIVIVTKRASKRVKEDGDGKSYLV